jgi:hypothetical protein
MKPKGGTYSGIGKAAGELEFLREVKSTRCLATSLDHACAARRARTIEVTV